MQGNIFFRRAISPSHSSIEFPLYGYEASPYYRDNDKVAAALSLPPHPHVTIVMINTQIISFNCSVICWIKKTTPLFLTNFSLSPLLVLFYCFPPPPIKLFCLSNKLKRQKYKHNNITIKTNDEYTFSCKLMP